MESRLESLTFMGDCICIVSLLVAKCREGIKCKDYDENKKVKLGHDKDYRIFFVV